jgi:hypothetical protein
LRLSSATDPQSPLHSTCSSGTSFVHTQGR